MSNELNTDVIELQQDSMFVDRIEHTSAVDCSAAISATIELGIVDRQNQLPSPLFGHILHGLPMPICGRTRAGKSQSQIVYKTLRHKSLADLRDELVEFLSAAEHVAHRNSAELLWKGVFPHRGRTTDEVTHGLNFEVAIPRVKAIKIVDRLQAYVPLFVGLSANSPILHGELTGLSSHRAFRVSNSLLGGFGGPFINWQRFNEHVAKLQDLGQVQSANDLNYFVRPSLTGMVELRCCDLPSSLDQVIALAALIQTLVSALAQGKLTCVFSRDLLKSELQEAIAKGVAAQLSDHTGVRTTPLQWLQRLRYELEPIAVGLGTDCALALASDVLADNGADRQIRDWQMTTEERQSLKVRPASQPIRRILRIAMATAAVGLAGLMAGMYFG